MTREELAQKAKVHERYLRELLSFNAASGYVTYDPEIKPDGTWMIVEPMARDRLEDNLNPVGRLYYAGSTMVCVPTSMSQEVGAALGAQAGEARLREVITQGGFRRVWRAAETPFNMILEARP
jgi:hypothetical protein